MLTTLNELQTDMSILLASTTNNQVQLFGKKIIVKNNFVTQVIIYLFNQKNFLTIISNTYLKTLSFVVQVPQFPSSTPHFLSQFG